jgi:hypothetical protein
MRTILSRELKAAGWTREPSQFQDLLVDLFYSNFHGWTDEDLLHSPRDGLHYCNVVREMSGLSDLSDRFILRTLSNYRKGGNLKHEEA